MKLRANGAAATCARLARFGRESRRRLLALSTSAALLFFPGEMVWAQETSNGIAEESAESSEAAGANGEAQAGAAATGIESNETVNDATADEALPPVIVEQEQDPVPASTVTATESTADPEPQQSEYLLFDHPNR